MKILLKNKHWKFNEDYNTDKILYLLIDRPTIISNWNDFIWKNNNNKCHRDYDLPAIIYSAGDYVVWYKNGSWHRENNKPARILVIDRDDFIEYYSHGKFVK